MRVVVPVIQQQFEQVVTAQLDMFAETKPKRDRKHWVRHPRDWSEVAIEPCEELVRMVRAKLRLGET